MTVSTTTNHIGTSLGTYLVHMFEVDTDHFQMASQKPRFDRDCEYLNRPYELSDLMRQATAAGV